MTAAKSERLVFLISKTGNILTHFATDREEFPAIATYERDRIFTQPDLLASLFHFANGGSGIIGGIPGVDQNTLSINGNPVAKVGAGELLSVQPANITPNNARVNALSPSVTVLAPRHYDLSNSLIDRDTLARMNEENRDYARQVAAYSGQQAAGAATRAAPSAVKNAQTRRG